MSIFQLRQLFNFAQLPYSTSREDIKSLKKVLMLELKHSKEGKISINNSDWFKNDLLQFFENNFELNTFDLEDFIQKNPKINQLFSPESIEIRLTKNEQVVFQSKEIVLFRNECEQAYLQKFKIAVKHAISTINFKKTFALLSYFDALSDEGREDVINDCKNSIFTLLKQNLEKKKPSYVFLSNDYISLVKFCANDNAYFLYEQYLLVHKYLNTLKSKEKLRTIDLQLQLEHDEQILIHLKDNRIIAVINVEKEKNKRIKWFIRNSMLLVFGGISFLLIFVENTNTLTPQNSVPSFKTIENKTMISDSLESYRNNKIQEKLNQVKQ